LACLMWAGPSEGRTTPLRISMFTARFSDLLAAGRILKREKVGRRNPQAPNHPFKFLERWRVFSPFDQTEKVHGHPDHLGEVLLSLVHLISDLPNPLSELLV